MQFEKLEERLVWPIEPVVRDEVRVRLFSVFSFQCLVILCKWTICTPIAHMRAFKQGNREKLKEIEGNKETEDKL